MPCDRRVLLRSGVHGLAEQPLQKLTRFTWSKPRTTAALLVAADELTDEEIAKQCDITRQTLANWKKHPTFQARIEEHLESWRKEVLARGIAERQNRVDALNDRWKRMQAVIEARAWSYAAEVAGGETGLLVKQERAIGTGNNQVIVTEYAVDTGLLRELRAHEQQAAKELGQWSDKAEHSGDIRIRVLYDDADDHTTETA